jgi:hypothetical protein
MENSNIQKKVIHADLAKIAQDMKNIHHFLDHLEAMLNEAIAKGLLEDIEREGLENAN